MSNLVRTIHSHSRGNDIKAAIFAVPGGYKSIVTVNEVPQAPTFGLVYEEFVEAVAQYVIDLSFDLDEESNYYKLPGSGMAFSFKSTAYGAH